jgi:beta-1,2-mannobiose phosphorylase / 1,2-beta-oligomannan phosphorylase
MMHYADRSRGRPFAKDPAVVWHQGRYLMYYSIPAYGDGRAPDGWAIGVASSRDLTSWERVGELAPEYDYEGRGFCAPGAIVRDGAVHLFYQTYGNGRNDSICHATSPDGIHFTRNPTNPIFRPTGDWNCGRAIDADVVIHGGRALLYYATRDPAMEIQMLGVAAAPADSAFDRDDWEQLGDGPILRPELAWEQSCIEAPAVCAHDGRLYMFYGGAYNNCPQQIGCAVSEDGVRWARLGDTPFLPNGQPGAWNSSESGHPFIFVDHDGSMQLFYQGNNDQGATWYLSRVAVGWGAEGPFVDSKRP